MRYRPPQPHDLRRLKQDLSRTGKSMATLFGLADDHQWRKYTGGSHPREMAPQMLFFGAAQLALSPDELERVFARMRAIGAEVDLLGAARGYARRRDESLGAEGEAAGEAEGEAEEEAQGEVEPPRTRAARCNHR